MPERRRNVGSHLVERASVGSPPEELSNDSALTTPRCAHQRGVSVLSAEGERDAKERRGTGGGKERGTCGKSVVSNGALSVHQRGGAGQGSGDWRHGAEMTEPRPATYIQFGKTVNEKVHHNNVSQERIPAVLTESMKSIDALQSKRAATAPTRPQNAAQRRGDARRKRYVSEVAFSWRMPSPSARILSVCSARGGRGMRHNTDADH